MNPAFIHVAVLVAMLLLIVATIVLLRRRQATVRAQGMASRWSKPAGAVVALASIVAVGDLISDMIGSNKPDARAVAESLSRGKTFPIRINEQVLLDSIESEGAVLILNYTFDRPGSAMEDVTRIASAQHDAQLAKGCQNPDFRRLMDKGLLVEFSYRYAGLPVGNVFISPNSCLHA